MLGCPNIVCIVWVCNPDSGSVQQPKYRLFHWGPHNIHGVGFAELNSYDIHGLSAIIARMVQHNAIRYILGTTGEGGHEQHHHPAILWSYIDYIFIKNNESVGVWQLLNPVLEDHCHSWSIVTCWRLRTGRLLHP